MEHSELASMPGAAPAGAPPSPPPAASGTPTTLKATKNGRGSVSAINAAKLQELQLQMAANQRAAARAHRRTASDSDLSSIGGAADAIAPPTTSSQLRSATASSTSTIVYNPDASVNSTATNSGIAAIVNGRPTHLRQVSSGGASNESSDVERKRRAPLPLSHTVIPAAVSQQLGQTQPQSAHNSSFAGGSFAIASYGSVVELRAVKQSASKSSNTMARVLKGNAKQSSSEDSLSQSPNPLDAAKVVHGEPQGSPRMPRRLQAVPLPAPVAGVASPATASPPGVSWLNLLSGPELISAASDDASALIVRARSVGMLKVALCLLLSVALLLNLGALSRSRIANRGLIEERLAISAGFFAEAAALHEPFTKSYQELNAALSSNATEAFLKEKEADIVALQQLRAQFLKPIQHICKILDCRSAKELTAVVSEFAQSSKEERDAQAALRAAARDQTLASVAADEAAAAPPTRQEAAATWTTSSKHPTARSSAGCVGEKPADWAICWVFENQRVAAISAFFFLVFVALRIS